MENRNDSPELKDFAKKILAVDVGIFLAAGVISLSLKVNFGVVLFVLGILVAVVASYLGGSHPYIPEKPSVPMSQLSARPSSNHLVGRILHNIKNSIPFYAIENVLMFAGLVAIVIGLPFICRIMFA